ncbi:MAG: hypothetical protein ACP5VR_00270 [Acidimicrobiales bacterium]
MPRAPSSRTAARVTAAQVTGARENEVARTVALYVASELRAGERIFSEHKAGQPTSGRSAGAVSAPGPQERLELLERTVAAQAAALRRTPLAMPLPREVLTLLTAPPTSLAGVPAKDMPRVVALMDQLQLLVEDLTLRERSLAGRIACVRAARRAGPAPHVVDCSS